MKLLLRRTLVRSDYGSADLSAIWIM